MSDLFASLLTPQVRMALMAGVIMIIILYVLSVVWVARDAYLRGMKWVPWTILAIVPIVGVIAYCLLRPPLYKIDRDEQELEISLKRRQLTQYGECGNCGYPVEADYVLCPHCHQRLKNMCPNCRRALDPTWSVCPYCATQIAQRPARGQNRRQARLSS